MVCVEEGHLYVLDNTEKSVGQEIVFMKKENGGIVHNGTTNEEVLAVLIDRLKYLDAKCACRENVIAITKLEECLFWLEKRTKDRMQRGVEGTDSK